MILKFSSCIFKTHKKNFSYWLYKKYEDYIFIIFLLKEYIKIKYMQVNLFLLKFILFLVIILLYIYIINKSYNSTFYSFNNYYKNVYEEEYLYWTYKNNKYQNFSENIFQKILIIKKISKTRLKGKIRKYKIILIIGNKKGWYGIGKGKDFFLSEAISKARVNSYKNIYINTLFYSNILKYKIKIQDGRVKKLLLSSSQYKVLNSKKYILNTLFIFIGLFNSSSKIFKLTNDTKILKLFL